MASPSLDEIVCDLIETDAHYTTKYGKPGVLVPPGTLRVWISVRNTLATIGSAPKGA